MHHLQARHLLLSFTCICLHYNSMLSNWVCWVCPGDNLGTTSLAGSSQCCAPTPPGTFSVTGLLCAGTISTPCPLGSFSGYGQTACIQCAAGFSCSSTDQTPCAPGQWSLAGSAVCSPCPPGFACPRSCATGSTPGSSAATFMSVGQVPLGDVGMCPCSGIFNGGFSLPSSIFANQRFGSLAFDSLGWLLSSAFGQPQLPQAPCGPGLCQSVIVPRGYLMRVADSIGVYVYMNVSSIGLNYPNVISSPTPSLSTTFYGPGPLNQVIFARSGSFQYSIVNTSACAFVPIACAVGTYAPSPGMSSCLFCPVGSACGSANMSIPVPCAAGSYANATGMSACVFCRLGQFSPGGAAPCRLCAQGAFCPSPGTENLCPMGAFNNQFNATRCSPCPVGTFCPFSGSLTPSVCPANTFANYTGQTACSVCPLFSQSNPGSAVCCGAGTYGNGTAMMCVPCRLGQFSPDGITPCRACAKGAYCPNPGVEILCPMGTYNDQLNATLCVSCPIGTFCVSPGSITPPVCPKNTFANQTGQTACMVCPLFSQSNAGSVACKCVANYYGPASAPNSGSPPCFACPPNSQTPDTGGVNFCACDVGYYTTYHLPDNTTTCTACPTGADCSVSDTTGSRTLMALAPLAGSYRWMDPARILPPKFYACPGGAAACLGASNTTCTEGFMGPLCAVCAPGFHQSGFECIACQGTLNQYLLPVVLCSAVVFISLFVVLARRFDATDAVVNVSKVCISYFQVMVRR
jgi:hypothetical protein